MAMGGAYSKESPLKHYPTGTGLEPTREKETRTSQTNMDKEHFGQVKRIGLTWETAKTHARDRKKWRKTVVALCSTRGKEE